MRGEGTDLGTTSEEGMIWITQEKLYGKTDLGEFWGDFLKYESDAQKKFRIV